MERAIVKQNAILRLKQALDWQFVLYLSGVVDKSSPTQPG